MIIRSVLSSWLERVGELLIVASIQVVKSKDSPPQKFKPLRCLDWWGDPDAIMHALRHDGTEKVVESYAAYVGKPVTLLNLDRLQADVSDALFNYNASLVSDIDSLSLGILKIHIGTGQIPITSELW